MTHHMPQFHVADFMRKDRQHLFVGFGELHHSIGDHDGTAGHGKGICPDIL